MGKNKNKPQEPQAPAPESKGLGAAIVESIAHAADKILHPDHAEKPSDETAPAGESAPKDESVAAGKQSSEPESETDQAPPSAPVESEMQDHKKFDKFK